MIGCRRQTAPSKRSKHELVLEGVSKAARFVGGSAESRDKILVALLEGGKKHKMLGESLHIN